MWLILGAVVIWGSMFVVLKLTVGNTDALATFLAWRFTLAAALFGPAMLTCLRSASRKSFLSQRNLLAGLGSGCALSAAFLTQAYGIRGTTVPNAAFLSSLYVLFTPILILSTRRSPSRQDIRGAVLSLIGTAILTGFNPDLQGSATALLVTCSFCYAIQIVAVGTRDKSVSAAAFTGYQMTVVAAVTAIASMWLDTDTPLIRAGETGAAAPSAWWMVAAIAYSGILGSALAFLLQTRGQRTASPTQTAIVFSLEPIVATALSALILATRPDPSTILGGGMILIGLYVSQLPSKTAGKPGTSDGAADE